MAKIENYKFGEITIDGKTYKKDLITFPNHIKTKWWREEGHLLQLQDLKEVWEKEDVNKLIVGKGNKGIMEVENEVKKKANNLGIELVSKNTGDACDYYNNLSENEKKKTVLALHLTC